MSDDKSNTGNPDRLRININEPYELSHWAKKFGVSANRLRDAVEKAGVMAADVEKELRRKD